MGEVVERGSPRAETGEMECDHPREPGGAGDVVGREIMPGRDRPAPPPPPWPVLAEQGPLVRQLERVPVRESDPVARREEQGRGLRSIQESGEVVLACLFR